MRRHPSRVALTGHPLTQLLLQLQLHGQSIHCVAIKGIEIVPVVRTLATAVPEIIPIRLEPNYRRFSGPTSHTAR